VSAGDCVIYKLNSFCMQPPKQPQVSTSLTLMPAQPPSHLQLLERPSLGLLFLRITNLKLNLDKKKIKTNITIQNKETDNGISGFQIIMSTQAKAVESNIILPDCNYYGNHYYYEGFHHQELLKKYHVIIPIQLILILLLRLNTTTAPKMEFHL